MINSEKLITRKGFLRVCGSILAGCSIVGISAILIHRRYAGTNKQTGTCNNTGAKLPDCSNCAGCPFQNRK